MVSMVDIKHARLQYGKMETEQYRRTYLEIEAVLWDVLRQIGTEGKARDGKESLTTSRKNERRSHLLLEMRSTF